MLAIFEAYRAGLLKPKNWLSNIISGLIVGIVALPLAMAFAIASGVKPEQGLYTAIIAGLFVGIFGGSRVQIAGPTGAFVVILASITAHYGVDGLQVATLLAGIFLLLMGFFKLGNVIKFIPDPVIIGFTTGIGCIIFLGEWKDFFGLTVKLPLDAHFHQKLFALIHALPNLNLPTTLLAILGLLLVIVTPKFLKRIPGPLCALIVVTLVQYIFNFKGVATLGSTFGQLPQHLPSLHLPAISIDRVLSLMGPALTVSLLGAIESLLSASVADGMAGTRHDSNQELIGQGLANLVAPLFGGFAATGAIARTATNVRNGGTSPVSAIVHSILLLLIILFLAPLASYVPLCTLAAILFVVAYNMSDLSHFLYTLKKAPRYDVLILLTTFLLTVFTDLVIAVNAGVILALLCFVRRMSQTVTVEKISQSTALPASLADLRINFSANDTLVYQIKGPYFFGVAEKIDQALRITHTLPKIIIFVLRDVPFMDITGITKFKDHIERCHQRGVTVYLCEANPVVARKLTHVGILRSVFGEKIFTSFAEIFIPYQKISCQDQEIIPVN